MPKARLGPLAPEGGDRKKLEIPVPPKCKSSDLLKQSCWRHRGKLDVPEERFSNRFSRRGGLASSIEPAQAAQVLDRCADMELGKQPALALVPVPHQFGELCHVRHAVV